MDIRQKVSRLLPTGIMVGSLVLFFGASVCSAQQIDTTGNNSENFNGAGPWNVTGLQIGNTANGTLDVSGGGQVVNTGSSQLGVAADATGTATITGAGSLWSSDSSSTKAIGFFGTGELNVLSGGIVTHGGAVFLGQRPSGSGTISVIGAGSHFDNTIGSFARLNIGQEGTGVLNIESGGLVTSRNSILGVAAGSSGTATVTGAGSQWNLRILNVGSGGIGKLDILDGGQVTSTPGSNASIGNSNMGTVKVEGDGSKLTLGANLTLGGSNGTGVMEILDGGMVTNGGFTDLGRGSSANPGSGTVKVSGVGSSWSTGTLGVGDIGTGELTVEAGAKASSTGITTIGDQGSSSGKVTVTGAGSQLIIASGQGSGSPTYKNLDVAQSGQAELNVLDGGLVENNRSVLGGSAGFNVPPSFGKATVSGAGSRWVSHDFLDVRRGTLDVLAGGVVTSEGGTVANPESGQVATATVSGPGSHWDASTASSTNFVIGDGNRTGVLDVLDGGLVTSSSGSIGFGIGSGSGTVNVTGPGSQWNNSGIARIGLFSTGTLNVNAGGVVTNTQGEIGSQSQGTGTVTVTGTGSQWNNSAELFVGQLGTGELNVQAGGLVSNTDATIARSTTKTGTVNVTGSGSQWNSSGGVFVGGSTFGPGGTGIVNIQSGGNVTVAGTMRVWNDGTVNLQGGTLTLATLDLTAPTATDDFNMTGGTLVVGTVTSDFIQDGGTLSPGASPGLTHIMGDYLMNAGSILFEIGGLLRGTEFDAIDVDGTATLDGIMDVNLINGFAASDGDSFQLVDAGAGLILGLPAFDFTDAVLNVGLAWDTSDFQSQGTIKIGTAVPEPSAFAFLALVAGATGAASKWRCRKVNADKNRT